MIHSTQWLHGQWIPRKIEDVLDHGEVHEDIQHVSISLFLNIYKGTFFTPKMFLYFLISRSANQAFYHDFLRASLIFLLTLLWEHTSSHIPQTTPLAPVDVR